MISMTGFGGATARVGQGNVSVEIKALNHRFLDIKLRLPQGMACFESRIRKRVATLIGRGRVDVFLSVEEPPARISIDVNRAKEYHRRLCALARALDMDEPVKLSDVVGFPGVIRSSTPKIAASWGSIEPVLQQVLREYGWI